MTFYHHDALGSVIAKSDADGYLYLNEEYQPYGEKIYAAEDFFGSSDDWYTGKNYSEELDLTYFGARWYDAKQGRFLSIDPIGVKLENIHSFNRYLYANNNPYKYTDPDGQEGQWADGNYWDFEAETMGLDARVGRAYQNLGKNIAENLETSPALIVGTGTVGIAAALAKSTLKKGITVIGHLPDYPKIAEKMGANFLKPSKDWSFQKQGEFIKDVIKRGDDVFIGTPIRQGPSVLKKEIKQLVKHGYRLLEQGSKWLIME